MANVWTTIKANKSVFTILAPMDDVTDTVFRRVVDYCGSPDLFFTEFINVDGLFSKGRDVLMRRLKFEPTERPIIAQIWGKTPENYIKAAQLIAELGFDGIDINMGCPDRKVLKNGCCAALINNQPLAKQIIEATIAGAGTLPVSVKTRIGVKDIVTDEWINFLLEFNLAAIAVHGRTAKEMSKVPVHLDQIARAVEIRNSRNSDTLIVGNGDIIDLETGLSFARSVGLDGIMIGRGIFHNPWIFAGSKFEDHTTAEKIKLAIHHVELFRAVWGETKNYALLKKFMKVYVNGFEGAFDLRMKLMQTENFEQALSVIKEFKTE